MTGNPSEFGPDSFVVGCTTSRLLDSRDMIDKDVKGCGFYPLGIGYASSYDICYISLLRDL